MVDEQQLVRMVPVLTAPDVPLEVAFYEWLGLTVTADYGDYVILATDPDADDAVEVHVSQSDDHDPGQAGSVFLRVRDAPKLYQRLHDDLLSDGRLFLAPAEGLTCEAFDALRAREEAGEDVVRLHEIEPKPWGQHEFAVIDPAGWLVRVGSPVG